MKTCGGCEIEKPLSAFSRCTANQDGLQNYCRACSKAARTEWAIANPERAAELRSEERTRNRGLYQSRGREYYRLHADDLKVISKGKTLTRYHHLRDMAIVHLGSICCRCGFPDRRALQIDHVNSDGASDRDSKSTCRILNEVLTSSPGERFQLVCANCNWILRHERGEHGARLPRSA